MQDFSGKVAVVTGGASGIGYALAERFAQEGCKLVLADIEAGALDAAVEKLRATGASVIGVPTDVRKRAGLQNLLDKTLAAYGSVQILCNNAGVQIAGPTWQISEAQWEWILGVNLWGVIHGVGVFVPRMLEQGDECHIVNTSSASGLLSVPLMSAYQVTKHGVVTLSESLSMELAQQNANIGVSVLCPAFVQTNLHEADRNRPAEVGDNDLITAELRAAIKEGVTALVAAGKPASEIADAVVRAMRERRVHIITHPQILPLVQKRTQMIVDAGG
jgi:NAD(P)-dependent dehydrogenase (short-subunit alcohol dehydrogenase family)